MFYEAKKQSQFWVAQDEQKKQSLFGGGLNVWLCTVPCSIKKTPTFEHPLTERSPIFQLNLSIRPPLFHSTTPIFRKLLSPKDTLNFKNGALEHKCEFVSTE